MKKILNDVIDAKRGVPAFVVAMSEAGGQPLTRDSVYSWRSDDRIPRNWWAPFMEVARRCGIEIDLADLREPVAAE